jgi:hypothetical protein
MKVFKTIFVAAIIVCIMALLSGFIMNFFGNAKREAPRPVTPVFLSGVRYEVPNTVDEEGIVEAWDVSSNALRWKSKIYSTLKWPGFIMETDVQFNFITNLVAGPAANELTVKNEKGREYILDTTTRRVRGK